MNSIFHRPFALHITKCRPPLARHEDIFDLAVQYKAGGSVQQYLKVLIPKSLQPAMLTGLVMGFQLETLEMGGSAGRLLPDSPHWLVVAVETNDGSRLSEVPEILVRSRIVRLWAGGALLAAGLAVLERSPLLGAALLLLGQYSVISGKSLFFRPFRFHMEQY